MKLPRAVWLSLGFVGVMAAAALFLRLGQIPLTNWDEGIYGDIAVMAHRAGSWWIPQYFGHPFLEKPPLLFWMMGVGFIKFAVGELAVRWFPAFCGVLTALLLTWWAYQMTKRPLAGLLAGLMFASGRFLFFHAFRGGDMDGPLVFFITAALYGYWKTKDNSRWWWLFGAATGLAVMTKSFVGLFPVVIAGADVLLGKTWTLINRRSLLQAFGIFVVIALPWHIAALTNGSEFWRQVVQFNLIDRSSTIIASANVPWYWYGRVIVGFFYPFSLFIPLAGVMAIRQWRDRSSRLLLLWAVLVVGLFTLGTTKYDHYIQPAYPALILMIALMFDRLLTSPTRWMNYGWWLSLVAIAFLVPARLAHSGVLWNITPFGWVPASWSAPLLGRVAISIISVAISWAIVMFYRKNPKVFSGFVLAGAIYFLLISFGWQFSYLKHQPKTSAAKQLAADIVKLDLGSVDVAISHQTEPALYFYLDREPHLTVSEIPRNTTGTNPFVIMKLSSPDQIPNGYGQVLQRDRLFLVQKTTVTAEP